MFPAVITNVPPLINSYSPSLPLDLTKVKPLMALSMTAVMERILWPQVVTSPPVTANYASAQSPVLKSSAATHVATEGFFSIVPRSPESLQVNHDESH